MSAFGPVYHSTPLQSLPFLCKLCNTQTEYTESEHLFKCSWPRDGSDAQCLGKFHFRCLCKNAIGSGDVTCPACKNPLSAKEVEELKNSNSGDIEMLKKDVRSIYNLLESMQKSIAAIEKKLNPEEAGRHQI